MCLYTVYTAYSALSQLKSVKRASHWCLWENDKVVVACGEEPF